MESPEMRALWYSVWSQAIGPDTIPGVVGGASENILDD